MKKLTFICLDESGLSGCGSSLDEAYEDYKDSCFNHCEDPQEVDDISWFEVNGGTFEVFMTITRKETLVKR